MIHTWSVRFLVVTLFSSLSSSGCDGMANLLRGMRSGAGGNGQGASAATTKPAVIDFEKVAIASAGEYRNWSLVDDAWRWAPTNCSAGPPDTQEGIIAEVKPRPSRSADATTHGRKLYRIFAKDAQAYAKLSPKSSATPRPFGEARHETPAILESIEQVIVKESWVPEPGKPSGDGNANAAPARPARPSKQSDLFLMLKLAGSDVPETDNGWIYATLTPDGKKVTGLGRIETCMKCHADAPHGRLFGLKAVETK